MDKEKVNNIENLSKYKFLNGEEKELLNKLSYLNQNFAEYLGHLRLEKYNPLRTYFRLNKQISSEIDLEERLISEGILPFINKAEIGMTCDTGAGSFYYLYLKESSRKSKPLVVYFMDKEQEADYRNKITDKFIR